MVFEGRGQRVRGLWERNGTYYAQVRTDDWVGQMPLHRTKTVPQALAERQALKSRIDGLRVRPEPGRLIGVDEVEWVRYAIPPNPPAAKARPA